MKRLKLFVLPIIILAMLVSCSEGKEAPETEATQIEEEGPSPVKEITSTTNSKSVSLKRHWAI